VIAVAFIAEASFNVRVRTTKTTIDGFTANNSDLAAVDSLGRTQGKVVSYHQLITTAATLDNGDRFLSHDELSRAMASITPSQLPPQVGELAAPAVMAALRAAWQLVRKQSASGATLPVGLSRVMVGSEGPVSSAASVYVAAYVSPSALKRMPKQSEIWFEQKQFDRPTIVHGPFVIDAAGVPLSQSAVPAHDVDVAAESSLLTEMPSQRTLRAGLHVLSAETFSYDATDDVDIAAYRQLAERQISRLSTVERLAMEKFTAYQSGMGQTPSVNDWLRGRSKGKNVDVERIDAAMSRAVALPPGTLLFRGFGTGRAFNPRVPDAGFMATSLDPGTARIFADNNGGDGRRKTLLVLEAGDHARGIVTGNYGETEVVLPRDLRLEVIARRRERGYDLVHVRFSTSGVG
jgi:hypothetical protein